MRNLFAELMFSLRLLRKNRSFSITCLVVITLGLTASLCVYSIIYEYAGPPPFVDGERFVLVAVEDKDTRAQQDIAMFGRYAFKVIKENVNGFEEFGAFDQKQAILSDGLVSRSFNLSELSPNLLSMTGVEPFLGRYFLDSNIDISNAPEVIISHSLWETYFTADENVIGSQTTVNGIIRTIVGVMPEGFEFPISQDLWIPLDIAGANSSSNEGSYILAGKLEQGIDPVMLEEDLDLVLSQLGDELRGDYLNLVSRVANFSSIKMGGGRADALSSFYMIAVIIFLLATLNLSTLLFTRSTERRQELAVRSALGANSWQLRKQVLLESAVLCIGGGIAAVLLSDLLLQVLSVLTGSAAAAMNIPITYSFGIHQPALVLAIAITFAIWLIAASATVSKISNNDINKVLEGGMGKGSSRARSLTMRVIISIEIIFSCYLLIICGLMLSSNYRASSIDYGTRTEGLLTGELVFTLEEYNDPVERARYLSELETGLVSESAISSVSFATILSGGFALPSEKAFSLEDRDISENEDYPDVATVSVSAAYFSMLEVPMLEGRAFSSDDNDSSLPVAIVNERFVETYWPEESAIGKRIMVDPENDREWLTVIGVSEHIMHGQPRDFNLQRAVLYQPLLQSIPDTLQLLAAVEPTVSLSELTRIIGRVATAVERDIPIDRLTTLYSYQLIGLSVINFVGQIISAFAMLALLLSVVGIYSIVSRSVVLRSNEIGIRRALGSSNKKIIAIFLNQGFGYMLLGTVLGGSFAILTVDLVSSVFPDIMGGVAEVSIAVLLTLTGLIWVASYLPVRKVIRMDPGDVLHYE